MIVIPHFKLYPAIFPLKLLIVYQKYRLSGEMLFLKRFMFLLDSNNQKRIRNSVDETRVADFN